MLMILSDQNTNRTEAILLAADTERMRAIVKDQDDTVEFRLRNGRWVSEAGQEFDIEAIVPAFSDEGCTLLPGPPVVQTGTIAAAHAAMM
jgi:hypothetical protein